MPDGSRGKLTQKGVQDERKETAQGRKSDPEKQPTNHGRGNGAQA